MNVIYNFNVIGKNILGMIKGSDFILCNEYVIIFVYLDYLGMIFFLIEGVNDNNFFFVVMLGVVEVLVKLKIKLKCSIIFMSVDGEEVGFIGSIYYINYFFVF